MLHTFLISVPYVVIEWSMCDLVSSPQHIYNSLFSPFLQKQKEIAKQKSRNTRFSGQALQALRFVWEVFWGWKTSPAAHLLWTKGPSCIHTLHCKNRSKGALYNHRALSVGASLNLSDASSFPASFRCSLRVVDSGNPGHLVVNNFMKNWQLGERREFSQSLSWLLSSVVRASNRQSDDLCLIPGRAECVFHLNQLSVLLSLSEKERIWFLFDWQLLFSFRHRLSGHHVSKCPEFASIWLHLPGRPTGHR